MTLKVRMVPHLDNMGGESGIKRVIQAYFKYLPDFGIELVDRGVSTWDITAAHAGIMGGDCDVAHLHGIYFTADYSASYEEWTTNRNVVQSALTARVVTVPSSWVAKTFQRDVRLTPEVLPHGIESELWRHTEPHENYVLWNKNRKGDVCNPDSVGRLAELAPDILFASTFAPTLQPSNVKVIGVMPHDSMKLVVQKAAVYLSTTKETFGIGILEALASGTPVLGWAYGGNLDLVQHGVTGYLAKPGNYTDLLEGLRYCLRHRQQLSENAVIAAKAWSWPNVIQNLAELYHRAATPEQPTASIIIPCYNKSYDEAERAVKSALNQDYGVLESVVIVDDCSPNGEQLKGLTLLDNKVKYIKTPQNSGVANARNYGISQVSSKYITCLDADDAIEPNFLSTCIDYLESHRHVGIAYTKLRVVNTDGSTSVSAWPHDGYSFERQMEHYNQIPTCNVFRRFIWERLGGYRQRYAPFKAGEEDAEFWLRIGSIGYGAALVTEEPLFLYHTGSNTVGGNPNHKATDWTAWHPWVKDKRYPFGSIAKPTNERSHPVRQYDEPTISVIIPVAPWHIGYLVDALDSLEAQKYRSWEVICILDGLPHDLKAYSRIKKAYPYIEIIENFSSPKGAGWARDAGVKLAKGKFLIFLDADDYLAPEFMEHTIDLWSKNPDSIIYTDYVDRAFWDKEEFDRLTDDRKLNYNPVTGEAIIRRYAKAYDCAEAVRQPEYNQSDANAPFYIWCIVTVLMPKVYYHEVGGFDKELDTWEDVDLFWRLARLGKCFIRLPEPLVTYRFTSGSRREHGMVRDKATANTFKSRINYLKNKYEELYTMPCPGGCGGSNGGSQQLASQVFAQIYNSSGSNLGGFNTVNDDEMIECLYDHANIGMHPVVGRATGKSYDYRKGGDHFLVHTSDIAAQPDIFKPIPKDSIAIPTVQEPVEPVADPPKLPDFSNVSGISKETEVKLVAAGIYNAADIVQAGKKGLETAGVLPKIAGLIINSAKKQV